MYHADFVGVFERQCRLETELCDPPAVLPVV